METAALGRRLLAAAAPAPGTVADPPLGGPAGPVLDVLLCLLPVAFLLVVTLSKRLFVPTARRCPAGQATAVLMPTALPCMCRFPALCRPTLGQQIDRLLSTHP